MCKVQYFRDVDTKRREELNECHCKVDYIKGLDSKMMNWKKVIDVKQMWE